MQDREQYRQILGIEAPWFVERVELKLAEGEVHSRFTALMERLVIDWLRGASQKAVGEQLGLSWDEIHGIMERRWNRSRTIWLATLYAVSVSVAVVVWLILCALGYAFHLAGVHFTLGILALAGMLIVDVLIFSMSGKPK